MSQHIVGACSRCGAPIYAPLIWHGITPPPSTYTCSCFYRTWAGGTTTTAESPK